MFILERISPTAPLQESKYNYLLAGFRVGFCLIWLLLTGLFFSGLAYSAKIITIDASSTHLPLSRFIDVLDNPDETIYPNNILDKRFLNAFTPINISNPLALNSFSSNLWLKFSVRNNTHSLINLWLTIDSHYIERFQLFKLNNRRLAPLLTEINNKTYISPLLFSANSTDTFFAKVSLNAKKPINIGLVDPQTYHLDEQTHSYLSGMMFGILIIVIILSFLCSIHYKELLFVYFSVYVFALLSLQILHIALHWQWIPAINNFSVLAIICVVNFCGIMQLKYYLESWSLQNNFKTLITAALVFNLLGTLLLALLLDDYSPYLWIVYTLLISLPVVTLLYCFRVKNDTLSLGILATKLIGMGANILFIFFNEKTINLHHVSENFVIYSIVFESSITLFLFIKHFENLRSAHHDALVFSAANNNERLTKTAIINEITHDLRTPVTGIMGIADLLKNTSLPANQLELVDSITHSGQLLLNEINEINSRLQLQGNDQILQKTTFELPLLIEECAYSYRLLAAEKNIEFIINIHNDIPVIVHGDLNRIRQILMQIIKNAIINTAQGEVIVSVQYLDIDSDEILFSVKDTGRGISQQELQSLQKLQSPQDQPEMSGLSVTKLQLRTLGSRLNISSRLGEGSEFNFALNLPKVTHHDIFFGNKTVNEEILKNKNILIVDDNHTCCKVLKKQATQWKMHAVETYDGNEALAMYRAKRNIGEPFDAIIIDYDMPHLSGLEVAEKILKESTTPPIMIMLTGLNVMPSEHIVKQAGIQAIINKPASQKIVKLTLIDLFINAKKNTSDDMIKDDTTIMNILIAEDNDVSRRVISKMLDILGYTYRMVSDGQLATDAVKKEDFDIILMDCEMPVMNGFDATLEIHRWQRQQGRILTPIIALSAHTMEEHKNKSRNAGMTDFLEKPIKLNELRVILARFKNPAEVM